VTDVAADTPRCTFHPSVPTLLSCTRCDRPACPDCLTQAAVGKHCRECLAEQGGARVAVARERTDHQRSLRRPGWLFWAIVALFALTCVLVAGTDGRELAQVLVGQADSGLKFASFLLVVSGWVVSLCLHEWAHAYVAYRAGDHSVVARGYLTLDPRKYSDPIFSVAIPIAFLILGGIGLPGGAVWIDHSNIRSRAARSLVSLAGPVVNIVFGIACVGLAGSGLLDEVPALKSSIVYLGWLEFATAALNLLPVPGLDGYGIIEPYLPYGFRAAIRPIANYAIIILLVLMISTDFGTFLFDIADAGVEAMGVDTAFVEIGRFIGDVRLI
jgi:Zn-dependent protease